MLFFCCLNSQEFLCFLPNISRCSSLLHKWIHYTRIYSSHSKQTTKYTPYWALCFFFRMCLWRINVILMLKIKWNSTVFGVYLKLCARAWVHISDTHNTIWYTIHTTQQTLIDSIEIAVACKIYSRKCYLPLTLSLSFYLISEFFFGKW